MQGKMVTVDFDQRGLCGRHFGSRAESIPFSSAV